MYANRARALDGVNCFGLTPNVTGCSENKSFHRRTSLIASDDQRRLYIVILCNAIGMVPDLERAIPHAGAFREFPIGFGSTKMVHL